MDPLAAVSVVLSVASHYSNVDIFKTLLQTTKENISVTKLPEDDNSFRIEFSNQSLVLSLGCSVTKIKDKDFCLQYESLVTHNQLCNGLTPQPYGWDIQHQAVVYEDLGDFAKLSDEIINSKVDTVAIRKLGTRLGQLHKLSHNASNSVVVRDLAEKFRSNPAVDQLIQSIFVETFDQQNIGRLTSDAIRTQLTQLAADESFVNKVASLKSTVQRKKECLSHGLLSTAAVGVKDGNVKLLSGFNGTFLGPCSFDLAALLADYIAFYHQHMLTEVDNDAHRQVSYKMVDACVQTVDAYLEEMTISVDGRDKYVERLLSDVAGLSGILLIARAVRKTYEDQKDVSKGTEALQSAVRLINAAHRIHSASVLVNIGLMLTF